MQRAVIYARYSPGPRQREESIEGQIRECKEYAKNIDVSVIATYIDRKVSGRTDNRLDFQRLLRDVERHIFDVIIVWKIDRFGRNREEIAINKYKCKKHGVKVLYAKESIPDGPAGIILESVLEGMAEYYSAELAEKVTRGMTENVLKGKTANGNVGLGYKIGEDKKIVLDEISAPTVRKIFEMFASGYKYIDIINHLNEIGLKTRKGGKFNQNAVHRILTNERYTGTYRWRDLVIEDGVPAIISKELFEKCQEKVRKVNRTPGGGRAKVEYLLTGKLFCGQCESHMSGESGIGKMGVTYNYYTCLNRKKFRTCKKSNVKKEWLERLVAETIYNEVLTNDEVIARIADAVMLVKKKASDGSLLVSLESQYTDVERSIKNLLRLAEQGSITSTTNERLTELEASKSDLSTRIAAERLSKIELTKNQVVHMLTQYRELDLNALEGQRRIIDTFVHSVYLYDDKIIITGNYTDDKGYRKEISVAELDIANAEKVPRNRLSESSDKLPLGPSMRSKKRCEITMS